MRIFNLMLCRNLGGIQQAFLDYNKALKIQGHEVFNIISSDSAIESHLPDDDMVITIPNMNSRCLTGRIKLRYLISKHKPDLVIAHGGRAVGFATFDPWFFGRANNNGKKIPIVGVSHNYSIKRLKNCDFVICLTEDLKSYFMDNGYPEKQLFSFPNMIEVQQKYIAKSYNKPIKIGSYGRFVDNKGFADLIMGFGNLSKEFPGIELILGGSGEEEESLKTLSGDLMLNSKIKFTGWIHDKKKFFDEIDIFCCPSHHEPFGIVILEAMEHSTPIVSSNAQGPNEILENGIDSLIFEKQSPSDLARKLKQIIENEDLARSFASKAYEKLIKKYDIKILSAKLSDILQKALDS